LEISVGELSRFILGSLYRDVGTSTWPPPQRNTDTDFEKTAGCLGAHVLDQVTAELASLVEENQAVAWDCEQGDIATISSKIAELARGQFKLWSSCFVLRTKLRKRTFDYSIYIINLSWRALHATRR
jgi:hypothetical protein